MGLFRFLWRLFGGSSGEPAPLHDGSGTATAPGSETTRTAREFHPRDKPPVKLEPLQYESSLVPTPVQQEIVEAKPYRFAYCGPRHGQYLDLSQDCDARWLEYYGLPFLKTPDELADWLHLPVGKLAWLTHRTLDGHRPKSEQAAHYHFRWIRKRSGGWRLIEAPKPELKRVQTQILREILDRVPPHAAAHGFIAGRSILTNAQPHVGKRYVLKFDLEDFYPSVRYPRVVAIYRSLGFSREVGIWLARLTTSALPWNMNSPPGVESMAYAARHLPQGAPTSPALANLSAFGLDVRLSGLARAYGLVYTRYADDLTFSGSGRTVPALREVISLVTKIIRDEGFIANDAKRRVVRNSQRMTVTGVVVNERINVSRKEFDRLKAILHNCLRHGPRSQNGDGLEDFAAHLRGRIAHVLQLNPTRGEKLLALYDRIDWSR
jgi:RNA-directed DNA polymerase